LLLAELEVRFDRAVVRVGRAFRPGGSHLVERFSSKAVSVMLALHVGAHRGGPWVVAACHLNLVADFCCSGGVRLDSWPDVSCIEHGQVSTDIAPAEVQPGREGIRKTVTGQ
jgi:hypothetical protein